MIARSVHQFSVWCILCLDNLPTWTFVFSIRTPDKYYTWLCVVPRGKVSGTVTVRAKQKVLPEWAIMTISGAALIFINIGIIGYGQDKAMMTARFFCLISLQTRNTAQKDSRLFSFRIITEIHF